MFGLYVLGKFVSRRLVTLEQRFQFLKRACLRVHLVQAVFHVIQPGFGEADGFALYGGVGVEFPDVPATPAQEHGRKNPLHVRPRHFRTLRRNRRRPDASRVLPGAEVRLVVLIVGAVLVPLHGIVEVVLQAKRLYVQPVVGFVQEQPQLAVDVLGAEILRRGAHQDDLVVAGFEV